MGTSKKLTPELATQTDETSTGPAGSILPCMRMLRLPVTEAMPVSRGKTEVDTPPKSAPLLTVTLFCESRAFRVMNAIPATVHHRGHRITNHWTGIGAVTATDPAVVSRKAPADRETGTIVICPRLPADPTCELPNM